MSGGDAGPAAAPGDGGVPSAAEGVDEVLDRLAGVVESARAVPMSASCVVNRAEVLDLVEQVRAALPRELEDAGSLLAEREALVEQGRAQAAGLVEEARARAEALAGEESVVLLAQERADRILADARVEADRLLREADDYCDRRLADFEIDIDRLLAQVRRGREKLRQRADLPGAVPASAVGEGAPAGGAGAPGAGGGLGGPVGDRPAGLAGG